MSLRYINFLIVISVVLSMASCSSRTGFQGNNVSYLYDSRNLVLRPEFSVYHVNDSLSRIHYRINSDQLLYMRNNDQEPYHAGFRLGYSVVRSFENISVIDSGAFKIEDTEMTPPKKSLTGEFTVKTTPYTETHSYVVRVVLTDLNRGVSFENFLRLRKNNEQTEQNFLLTDTAGNVLFKNHVATGAPFLLTHNSLSTVRYFVSHFSKDFPIALPPYSSTNPGSIQLKPDTVYTVDASQPMTLKENGFYHFQIDTSNDDGYTVYSFYDEFPYIAKRLHLAPPLRYITTKKEFERLMAAGDDPVKVKKEVDDFWLDRSGSVERSRILLQAYYKRIQEANIFFSSYLEGWKTDRGIIYTIYGPPDRVYRSSAGEAWVYGDETSSLSYYFSFLKVNNPYTDNDFMLNRLNTYRYGWGQAIDAWRNGRIYNSKDIQREQDNSDQYHRQRTPYWY